MRPYQSEWFRPKTAAKYLDSSDSTLAKMRLRGDGPAMAHPILSWGLGSSDITKATSTPTLPRGLVTPHPKATEIKGARCQRRNNGRLGENCYVYK
jgi:hypothetical protein